MSFREPPRLLRDISDAIEGIEQFTAGMDFEAFCDDAKTIAAVERKLQIITEAATRLGKGAETAYPGLPWRDIRGMGNWLRHQYERIELPVIWRNHHERSARAEEAVLYALMNESAKPKEPGSPGSA